MKSWWRATAGYAPTWIALGLLVIGSWLFLSILDPPGLVMGLLIALVILSIAAWPLTMATTGTLTRLQFAIPRVDEIDPEVLTALEAELAGLEDDRPSRQLQSLNEKKDNLAEILHRRLDAGELTFGRYLATSQEVYEAALDNLHEAAVSLRSISAIDEHHLRERLADLEQADEDGAAALRELESLRERLGMHDGQTRRVADLLAQNESAMTALDRTATALAAAPIGRRPQDADAAMEALEELAARADRYASG